MKEKRNFVTSEVIVYLILFFLCLLPEAIYIGSHGFYWDDWSQLFLHTKFGDDAFPDYYAYNRPLSAWTDMMYFPICGGSPLRWHLLMIVLRFLLCRLFYKILISIMPGKGKLSFTAAILLAVCPLFSQSYISIAYTQHFTDFVLYGLSVLLLYQSACTCERPKKFVFYLLSVVCTIIHLTITEYFVFLELIKIPVLIAAVNNKNEKRNYLYNMIKYYTLHFLIFVLYCLYRLKITDFFPNAGQETPELLYLFQHSPVQAIHSFLKNTAVDLLYPFTGFLSRIFDFNIQSILTKQELVMILISLLISSGVYFVLKRFRKTLNNSDEGERTVRHVPRENCPRTSINQCFLKQGTQKSAGIFIKNPKQNNTPVFSENHKEKGCLILICLAGIFLGVLPFLIMNENALNNTDLPHADRTFLAAMPFACLLFSFFLSVFFPNHSLFAAAAALIVFLFCHGQMSAYLEAKLFTEKQNSFYQQLSVRIPGIADGTAFVDDSIIFPEQGNFATASALNILYPNAIRENGEIPLWVFSYPERTRDHHSAFNVQNRIFRFQQSASDYIYLDYDNQFANCVWIFTPQDVDNPHITDLQRGWIAGTGIDRVELDAVLHPDESIFGREKNNWCHYYQQAGLLMQKEDWNGLSNLTADVLAAGFSPSDSRSNSPFEWWPFLLGLLHEGKTEEAQALADEAVRVDGAYKDFFDKRFADFMITIHNEAHGNNAW